MSILQPVILDGLLDIVSPCTVHYSEELQRLSTKGNQRPLTQERTGKSLKNTKLMVSTQVQLVFEQSESKTKMVFGSRSTTYHLWEGYLWLGRGVMSLLTSGFNRTWRCSSTITIGKQRQVGLFPAITWTSTPTLPNQEAPLSHAPVSR